MLTIDKIWEIELESVKKKRLNKAEERTKILEATSVENKLKPKRE